MFTTEIIFSDFDYALTIQNLLPTALEKLTRLAPEHTGVLLLQKLDLASADILAGILDRLTVSQRNTLYCQLVSANRTRITRIIADALQAHDIGRCFSIGQLRMIKDGDRLRLFVEDVQIDYKKLIQDERVIEFLGGKLFLAKTALAVSQRKAEKIILSAAQSAKYKNRLLSYINNLLKKAGIIIRVEDFKSVEKGEWISTPEMNQLTHEQQCMLIDAFADYLNDMAKLCV